MRVRSRVRSWLRAMLRRSRVEKEMDAELRFHIEAFGEDLVRSGVPRQEAYRRARLAFGGIERAKEECRDARGVSFLETLLQDLRYGLRMLRKTPGFTGVAVLTLALGIGANTAIFSLVNALMLRTLPVRDPGTLVELLHRSPGEPHFNGFSWDAYRLMRDHNHVLSGMIAVVYQPFVVRGGNLESETVVGGYVDGTFFHFLGLKPAIGRLLSPEDDQRGQPSAVAVVDWTYWKSKFNLDPAILGKQIIVNDTPVVIVGVAPRGFFGLSHEFIQDVWLPLAMEPVIRHSSLGWGSLTLVGRLRSGVSIEQAQAEMAVLFRTAIEAANTNPFIRMMKFEMESAGSGLSSPLRQRFSKPLLVLMTIVSVLLLLACTNVASLLLARGAARQHEMGVRICLGAGRLRLLRQVLTESLLLSVAGSLFGVYLAYFGANALLHIIRSGRMMLPPHFEIRLDPDLHVLLFTGSVALLTAVLFGLAPAVRALRTAPAAALQQSGRTGETSFRWLFGKALVVAQVAFSVMLLSAAALFLGYLSNLRNLDLGFRKDHLLLVTLDPAHSGSNNQQLARQCQQLLDRLAAIPGVRSATLSGSTPISGAVAAAFATVEGHLENRRVVSINYVAPNFFQTYSTPLLAGRDFVFRDQTGPHVAIINQAMARDYFGDDSPIGKHVTLDHVTQRGDEKPTYEIVGVVGGAKYSELREVPPRTIYLDTFQDERLGSQLTLRTGVNPEAVIPDVNQAVNELLKTVPIARVTTMADQVDAALVPERLIATLSGCFGALGTLLAAVGVYGLLAYTVTRRTHEIGIRIALGASYSKVTRMVVGDALRIAGVGTAAGTLLAFWGRRFAAHLIQDLPMKSIFPVFVGTVAMIAIALLAAYLPARRAATVDPMVALRYE